MIIFYIRHGDPIYDPDQLTELGHAQAEAVSRRFAKYGVDKVYASTSNRAIQTAMPTCEKLGLELTTLDFLNENDLGGIKLKNAVGKNDWLWSHPEFSEILCSREVRTMGDEWYKHPKLADYHFENVIHPIQKELDKLIASHGYVHDPEKGLYRVEKCDTEKKIAIFAHESVGKIVMSHLLDIPYPYYAEHFEMHTSAITAIFFDVGTSKEPENTPRPYARARVMTLSNDAHLYNDEFEPVHRFTHMREIY